MIEYVTEELIISLSPIACAKLEIDSWVTLNVVELLRLFPTASGLNIS
ncbi:unannotated protein [freshwater metagenome]|uniref:Unannotated protein n=1 Tax=freshwater metagenome TaxID=449393 RepID=A0A6J7K0H0_9ZZZZ